MLPRLMLVTDRRRARGGDLVRQVAAATRGGVRLIQIREPDLGEEALHELAARILNEVPRGTKVVVNGSLGVARSLRTGLHLPARAVRIGAPEIGGRLYGRSAHDEDEMRAALTEGVDYLVVGTVFATDSKPGRRPAGIALVERICRQVHPLPVFAIGGITISRVPAVMHAGAWGVAVCGAILAASNPQQVTEALLLALDVSQRTSGAGRL